MGRRFEPFALMLHRRHSGGESVAELAAAFQISEERVVERLRAASIFAERQAMRTAAQDQSGSNEGNRGTESD